MFHQHVPGAMILWKGRRLVFHSVTPTRMVKYQGVMSGGVHKWTTGGFERAVDDGEIKPMLSVAGPAPCPQTRGAVSQHDERLMEAAIDRHCLELGRPSAASAYRLYRILREDAEVELGNWGQSPASLRTFQRRIAHIASLH